MDIIARLANLPGALPGACAQGLIWGIMAIGVYLTYRILDVADLTVDGSFGTGGAVCVMCLLSGMNVWPDCRPGDWFYLAVQEATNSHDYKHKAGNYETWTGMNKDPDWTRYEN